MDYTKQDMLDLISLDFQKNVINLEEDEIYNVVNAIYNDYKKEFVQIIFEDELTNCFNKTLHYFKNFSVENQNEFVLQMFKYFLYEINNIEKP